MNLWNKSRATWDWRNEKKEMRNRNCQQCQVNVFIHIFCVEFMINDNNSHSRYERHHINYNQMLQFKVPLPSLNIHYFAFARCMWWYVHNMRKKEKGFFFKRMQNEWFRVMILLLLIHIFFFFLLLATCRSFPLIFTSASPHNIIFNFFSLFLSLIRSSFLISFIHYVHKFFVIMKNICTLQTHGVCVFELVKSVNGKNF
jgi:hypothetical protein